MEGQTGEAWVHPKTSDVLLDNGKHKKKENTLFVLCRLQNVKRKEILQIRLWWYVLQNWAQLARPYWHEYVKKKTVLRKKNPWGRTDNSRHRGTTPSSPTYKKSNRKNNISASSGYCNEPELPGQISARRKQLAFLCNTGEDRMTGCSRI